MKLKKRFGILMILAMLVSMMAITANAAKISNKRLTIGIGSSYKLSVKGGKAKWATSNAKVATVSKKGVVKGKSAGKATITATVGKKALTCKVTVKKPTLEFPNKLTDSDFNIQFAGYETMPENGQYEQSVLDLNPYLKKSPSNITIKWSSSDKSIATVKDGVVTGLRYGKVRITAKSGPAKASVMVTISEAIENNKVVQVTQKNFDKYFEKIEWSCYYVNKKDAEKYYYYEFAGAPVDLQAEDEKGNVIYDAEGKPVYQYFDGMSNHVAYVLKNPDAFDMTKSWLDSMVATAMYTPYYVALNGSGYTLVKQCANTTTQPATTSFDGYINKNFYPTSGELLYGQELETGKFLFGTYSPNVAGKVLTMFDAEVSYTDSRYRRDWATDTELGTGTRMNIFGDWTIQDVDCVLYYK